MDIIIIGPVEQNRIAEVIKHAKENIVSYELLIKGGNQLPNIKDFTVCIPNKLMVIYSIEDHKIGLMKHLSVSIDLENRIPAKEAVIMILEEFKFINNLNKCIVKKLETGKLPAINVWEPLDGNWEPYKVKGNA